MGYRPPPTNILLRWAEDHRMHGMEVNARGLRLGPMLDLAEMYVSSVGGKEDESELTAEDVKMMRSMFELLVGKDEVRDDDGMVVTPATRGLIISWNHDDDDGEPLPVSMAGIRQLELWQFQGIMSGYLESGGVKLEDPLSEDSKSGKQSAEPTALMALESLSQVN